MSKKCVLNFGLLVGFFFGVESYIQSTEYPCRKPGSPNSDCASPSGGDNGNSVDNCSGIFPAPTCIGSGIFEIRQFPTTTVPSATGETKTNQADCWKRTPCILNNNQCVAGTRGPWNKVGKVTVDEVTKCPDPS